jgi:hypothetical protein
MRCARMIPVLLVSLLLATSAMSQSSNWAAVQALPGGTKIKVQLKQGRTFGHCFFDGATDNQLACTVRGGFFSRRVVYPRDNVKAVYQTHNGPLIGFGVGAAAGAGLGAASDPVPGLGRGGTALVDAGILGGVGAFFGMVADPFFHGRAVYRSPNDPKKAPDNAPNLKDQAANPGEVKIPCLRDGITLQCMSQ